MAFVQRGDLDIINGRINNSPIGAITPSTGAFTTINTTGNVNINGNLIVSGTTTTLDSTVVLIKDQHLYLNNGYNTVSAKTGGLVVNRLPTSSVLTTTGAGVFTPGIAAVSNPTISLLGATPAVLTTGMFVQISGASSALNKGLFEVQANNTATLLTLRGIGITATVEDFTQTQLITETNTAISIRAINISVLRNNASTGFWETAFGASTGLTFGSFMTGPGSSTTNGIATWNGTSGSALNSTTALMSATGNLTNLNSENFISTASNPGSALTVWQNSANSHIYHGTNDMENLYEFKYQQSTTPPNSLEPNAIASSFDNNYYASASSANSTNTGIVYVYKKTGLGITLLQTITASDATINFNFGSSICFDYTGTRLFVGSTGRGTNAGAVYVYLRISDTFAQEQIITATGGASDENLGASVCVNYVGDVITIGAPNTSSNGLSRALIFTRSVVTWTQGMALVGTGIGTGNGLNVGFKVAMNSDAQRIIVSALRETTFTGSVSIFKRTTLTGSTWTEEQKLLASDAATNARFGSDITIGDNGFYIVIGATTASNGGTSTGKAYTFRRSNVTWTQSQIILPPTADLNISGNTFGTSMSLSYDANWLMIFNPVNRIYLYYLGGNDSYYIVQTIVPLTNSVFGSLNLSKDGQTLIFERTSLIDVWYDVAKNHVTAPEVTASALAFFNGSDGKVLADSVYLVDTSFNLTLPFSLKTDTIVENTTNNGVLVSSVTVKLGALNLLTAAANPGNSNTLWQRTSDGHVFRGAIDLEAEPDYTVTNVTASPYTVLSTDTFITVDASGGARTLNLPAISATTRVYRIADKGNAGTNNITITANGANTIKGIASLVINTNYGSVRLSSDNSGAGFWYTI